MKTGGLVVWQRPGFADGTIRERPRIGQRRSEASNNLLEVLAPHLLALHGHDEKKQIDYEPNTMGLKNVFKF
jgi:hypothetical protein